MWLAGYGFLQFVCTSKVADFTLDSSYRTFCSSPEQRKSVEFIPIPMPLIFLGAHFIYYFVLHCWAVLLFHCRWLNLLACLIWCTVSFFQGANYYMDYFSKKYEVQLAKLSQLQEEVVSTPTLKVAKQTSPSIEKESDTKKTQ